MPSVAPCAQEPVVLGTCYDNAGILRVDANRRFNLLAFGRVVARGHVNVGTRDRLGMSCDYQKADCDDEKGCYDFSSQEYSLCPVGSWLNKLSDLWMQQLSPISKKLTCLD